MLFITKVSIRAFKERKRSLTQGRFGETGDIVEHASSTMHLCVRLARSPHALVISPLLPPLVLLVPRSIVQTLENGEMIYTWGTQWGPVTWPSTLWTFDVLWVTPTWRTCTLAVSCPGVKLAHTGQGKAKGWQSQLLKIQWITFRFRQFITSVDSKEKANPRSDSSLSFCLTHQKGWRPNKRNQMTAMRVVGYPVPKESPLDWS